MRLTDLRIRQLKPPPLGQKTYFDDALRGFGVRVSQGGSKSFVVMYGRARRLKTIGRYPALSLAEARRLAKRLQAEILEHAAGGQSYQEAISFKEARCRFLADSRSRNKPRTHQGYFRLLHRHFDFDMNLDQITRGDIMAQVDGLQPTPSEQQHAFTAMRVMMNWCVKRGLLDMSPVPRMSFSSPARSRVLSDAELATVMRRAIETDLPYGVIVQLLILTGQRRGEIAALRRNWVSDGWITFPEGFTKNRREHRIPISPRAQGVLDQVPEISDLYFPARGAPDRPFGGWGKCKLRFDSALVDVDHYTLHDLRRTFSSNMARIGTQIHVTERILNHVSGTLSGVAAVYNRYSYLDEMREAMVSYDSYIAHLLAAV